ncbi:MAG: type II toxin-antitoxin system YafQ family toxin [Rickettsiales bacterium]
MLTIRQSTLFKKDLKRLKKSGVDLSKLELIVIKLVKEEKLDKKYRDHILVGNWKGFRECHIAPDWLLIYRVEDGELQLARTGSHSKLF